MIIASINHLKTAFQTLKKGTNLVEKYLLDSMHLKNQFNAAGERIYDHDIVMAALNGLSSDLVMNTTVIFACETPICLQEFRAQLLGAETIIESGMLSLTSQLHALMVQYESESVFKVAWNFSG